MTASFAPQEIWHVMIASDDMKRMNVDQLDDAFRLDIVDASTLVWKNGMEKWRRLGSIAELDEEPETIARPLGPPSPPPPPRPRHHQTRSVAPSVNPFVISANPFAQTAPYASNTPAAVFSAPQLVAPVHTPQLFAPDPYVMPKRRAKVPSEVDFRRGTGVRWGRWLFAFVLLTGCVVGAYRQNYLREGARRVGLENKFLYSEKRVTGWITAKTPGAVQAALRQLKLLPTTNALGAAPLAAAAPAALPAAPTPVAPAPETVKASGATPAGDPDVKTVSLDSLPVLGSEPAPEATPGKPAPAAAAPKARAVVSSAPKAAPKSAKKAVAVEEEDEPAPKPAKAKAEPKPEPKVEVKPPPPSANEGFLKSAIREAIANDTKKK